MSDSTPPNWPIHNVNLTDDEICKLVKRVFPLDTLVALQRLDKSKSFNNRIYFICTKNGREDGKEQNIVLKVIGRFFDSRKIQNEVASLLLQAEFCPSIPAPRALAWSEDGKQIVAVRNGKCAVLPDESHDDASSSSHSHPWILMTKCPGEMLAKSDLAGGHGEHVADQLADVVMSWRRDIPCRQELGNLKLHTAAHTSSDRLHGLETVVSGSLLSDTQPDHSIKSLQEYYDHLLADQMYKLETNGIFAYLRPKLLEDLRLFHTKTFPHLPCFAEKNLLDPKNAAVFTHQDLSPRNILVLQTNSGPAVSGVIDFEFSGFFAPEEEFLTSLVRQGSDWPKPFMDVLLTKLKLRGISVPTEEANQNFKVLFEVVQLIEDVAPWWLQAGHVTGRELELQLEDAYKRVKASMERLVASVPSS